MTTIDPF